MVIVMDKNDKLQEKLDLLSALKEDEEKNKKKKKDKFDLDPKKEAVLEEIKKVKDATPKQKNILLIILSFLALVISISYFLYNITKAKNNINQPYLIANSGCLIILSILLVITGFVKKKKGISIFNKLNILAITSYVIFQFLVTTETIKFPTLKTVGDLSNMSINEVIKWASSNHVKLEQTYEYSESIDSNYVISQDIPADTLLKKVEKIEVIVSNGPNYELTVNIPNMVGWKVDDVVKKIKEEKLSNTKIEFNFNEAIEKDILYEQSKSGEMKRNDEFILKFSLGSEADLKPVELIDLIKKEEFDATLWLKRNGIQYEISYEFHNNIEKGKVISTTPAKGTTIDQKTMKVKLVISKGPKIIAPDLTKMSLEEISEWATKNKLVLNYTSEYNDKIKAGDIIRVSVKKGDPLEENMKIEVVTSKGTLKMISISDGDITALRNFATENNLTLTETEEFHDSIEKGKFISISKKTGDTINSTEEIKVIISLGKSVELPNFIGMNVNNAKNTCKNTGITCQMSYVYSSKTKGTIFNQSMTAGSKVIGNTHIVLTVSNGPKPSSNSGNSNNNYNGGSTNNNTGNNNNNSNNNINTGNQTPPTQTCVNYTLRLGAGGNVQQTQSIIKQLNPNGKFSFKSVNPGYGTNGSLRNDMLSTYQGTTHTSCETITIYIIDRSL